MTKKIFLVLLIIFSLIGGGIFVSSKLNASPKEVQKTVPVKQGSLKIAFSIDGKTSIERRDLKFTVNGKVSNIAVKEGQTVKRGQYLISLDTQDVQKNLQKDLKDYMIARNSFEQTTQVTYPSGGYVDDRDTIKRVLQNTQYSLDKSVLDVEIRNIALKESSLYSPIDGIVSAINIRQGETTNTQNSEAVITITKPDSLYFEAYAEDTEALKINKDQKTVINLDALSSVSFPSEVEFISNLATIDQNGLSTYKIRAIISDQKSNSLLDGMSGQIQFITKEKSGILIIPNSSVFRENDASFVNKVSGRAIIKTEVQTGFTDGKDVEVVTGLAQGDEVVVP